MPKNILLNKVLTDFFFITIGFIHLLLIKAREIKQAKSDQSWRTCAHLSLDATFLPGTNGAHICKLTRINITTTSSDLTIIKGQDSEWLTLFKSLIR